MKFTDEAYAEFKLTHYRLATFLGLWTLMSMLVAFGRDGGIRLTDRVPTVRMVTWSSTGTFVLRRSLVQRLVRAGSQIQPTDLPHTIVALTTNMKKGVPA
jgi:hypothetical protein